MPAPAADSCGEVLSSALAGAYRESGSWVEVDSGWDESAMDFLVDSEQWLFAAKRGDAAIALECREL